jgi:hypothetical protein
MYFTDPGDSFEHSRYLAKAITTDHSFYFQFFRCHSNAPYTNAYAQNYLSNKYQRTPLAGMRSFF